MQNTTAKVFNSGNSQAVRLPKAFRLDTDEVFIRKVGNQLILTPKKDCWQGFTDGFTGFSEDFSTYAELPEDTPRRRFD